MLMPGTVTAESSRSRERSTASPATDAQTSRAASASGTGVNATAGTAASLSGGDSTLTPAEKKANHIQSEQKRRQVIRDAFDELTMLVPGLGRSQSKSEAIVLRRTVEHIHAQQGERNRLMNEVEALERELS